MNRIIGTTPTRVPKVNVDIRGVMLIICAVALLVSLGVSVPSVFAASAVAGATVVLVIGVVVALYIMVSRQLGWKSLPSALLALSALWVALSGLVVFEYHWLAFTPAAWVLNVLYVAALANGAYSGINRWMRIVAKLLAYSLIIGAFVLPRPAGGEGPFDTAKEWSIDILVNDEESRPIEGAQVLCGPVMKWSKELGLPETLARQTDSSGRLTWKFVEDPRLKLVVCTAWQNANRNNSGYPATARVAYGGGDHELRFMLFSPSTPNP